MCTNITAELLKVQCVGDPVVFSKCCRGSFSAHIHPFFFFFFSLQWHIVLPNASSKDDQSHTKKFNYVEKEVQKRSITSVETAMIQ